MLVPSVSVLDQRVMSNPMMITARQRRARVDDSFAETTWNVLHHAIREINKRRTSQLSYEELYRLAYNMVLHKHGKYLYEGLQELLADHLKDVANTINSATPANFLNEINTQWEWFERSLGHVRDVLMYMDRAYVRPKQKKSVNDLGVSLFHNIVIRNVRICPRLVDAVLALIDAEREGETIDTSIILSITRMLNELGTNDDGECVYVAIFENAFIQRTRQFYARESQQYLAESTCSEYLRKAAQRLREEKRRVETYLAQQTEKRVVHATREELITKYMSQLVDMPSSGLVWMLRNDKVYDLRLMHTLFRDVPGGDDALRSNLRNEVLQRGNALVREAKQSHDPNALVNSVLELKEKYDRILGISFCMHTSVYSFDMYDIPLSSMAIDPQAGPSHRVASSSATGSHTRNSALKPTPDKRFMNTVNESFERFINAFQESAEYISLYVDKLIRKDFKGSTDDEIEAKLDSVMTLFRFLSEKDVFEKYYKIHLARRLLESRSCNVDAERSFISKMKNECGYLYTSKMEVMFKDVKMSEECSDQFSEYMVEQNVDVRGIDLKVSVLTTLSWPIAATPEMCVLPQDAIDATAEFEKFYLSKHNGRVLTWQRDKGSAELRGRFGEREVDIIANAHAMCVLMLYNNRDSATFAEILQATRIPEEELKRIMQSLSLAKYRILCKSPPTKEVQSSDVFSFNEGFTSRTRRVKIQIIAAPREKVQSQMRARIDDDRKPLIEAAVVRVMKANRVMEHTKLMVEVTNQLLSRFNPNPQDIKRRIESLVEREFLERKDGQRQVYQYIA